MTAPREPLVWSDRYATGVEAIDEQHMILVHTLNEAATKLAEDASVEHLDRITQDLLAYALYHFETEESLMQQYGYEEGSPEGRRHPSGPAPGVLQQGGGGAGGHQGGQPPSPPTTCWPSWTTG
jgi:hypothetical protein